MVANLTHNPVTKTPEKGIANSSETTSIASLSSPATQFYSKESVDNIDLPNSGSKALHSVQLFGKNEYHQNNPTSSRVLNSSPSFPPIQRKVSTNHSPKTAGAANKTGLPDNVKSGVEQLSGVSLSDVKVHYNSPKPAQLHAHAYAQGTDIHVASGQEKHVPHEAWHVVQQKQGRVQATKQMKGEVPVNDDAGLENEADVMGAKAVQMAAKENGGVVQQVSASNKAVAQLGMFSSAMNWMKKGVNRLKRMFGVGGKEEKNGGSTKPEASPIGKKDTTEDNQDLSGRQAITKNDLAGDELELMEEAKEAREAKEAKIKSDSHAVTEEQVSKVKELKENGKNKDDIIAELGLNKFQLATAIAKIAAKERGQKNKWEQDETGNWIETEKKVDRTNLDAYNIKDDEAAHSDKKKWLKAQEDITAPTELFSEDQINAHLGKFIEGAHAFIDPNTSNKIVNADPKQNMGFKGWGIDYNFVAPLNEAEALNKKALADKGIATIEKDLGIPEGNWGYHKTNPRRALIRWIIPSPDIRNINKTTGIILSMATGKEVGADPDNWRAGGLTTGGNHEAVLKAIPREDLIKQLADEKIITKEQIYENTEYKNEEKGEVTQGHKK